MRASISQAEAHILAVKAQSVPPPPDGNIRTVLELGKIKQIAQSQGWRLELEGWIEQPDLEDGKSEVNAARNSSERTNADTKQYVTNMEDTIDANGGDIRSMDVWTSFWSLSY